MLHLDAIRALERHQRGLDTAIARGFPAFRHTLTTIPRMGPVYDAGLLAQIGPVDRFASENALANHAGLTGRLHQSGRVDADIRPPTRSRNVYLRSDCVEAAERVRVRDPYFQARYAKKYREAWHHAHEPMPMRVLTARQRLSVLKGVLTRGPIYDARQGN